MCCLWFVVWLLHVRCLLCVFVAVVPRRFVLLVACVLLRVRCLLFVVSYVLSVFWFASCWLLVGGRCLLLFVVCYLLIGVCCLVVLVFSLLFVVCGVCCLSSVARCSLHVECCVVVVLLLFVCCLLLYVVCL